MRPSAIVLVALLAAPSVLAYAGFTSPTPGSGPMLFDDHVIHSAVSAGVDLTEPHVSVSPDGTVYVGAHALGVASTRTPIFISADDGRSWYPPADPPAPASEGPVGREGAEGIVVGMPGGEAWLFDNGASGMPLYKYCLEGKVLCDVRDAYDHSGVAAARTACEAMAIFDRPWIAPGPGGLFLVNAAVHAKQSVNRFNDGHYIVQLGWLDTTTPGALPTWAHCFAHAHSRAGVPAVRASDGLVAFLLEVDEGAFRLFSGPANDPSALSSVVVDGVRHAKPCGGSRQDTNWGQVAFDAAGRMFAAYVDETAQLTVATSTDGADVPEGAKLRLGPVGATTYYWLTGSPTTGGALLTYATAQPSCTHQTFHAVHLRYDEVLERVVASSPSVVATDVPYPCGHYMGSSLGPDGRAYVVVYSSTSGSSVASDCMGALTTGTKPLHLFVQRAIGGGPTLS